MDPEIKRALEELKALAGRSVEALPRIEAVERAAQTQAATVTELRKECDEIKRALEAKEQALQALTREFRIVRQAPADQRRAARELFGMLCRADLCRFLRQEVPSDFRNEAEVIRDHVQRATLTTSNTGAYVVPTITEAELIETLEEVSDLLSRVDFIPGLPAASTINIPTLTGRATLQAARAGTDTAMSASDPTFGQLQLTPAEAYIYFPVDNRLIQMSALSLGTLLMDIMRQSLVAGICNWLINGDATSTYNSVRGIINENTAAYLSAMPSGKTAFSDLDKAHLTAAMAKTLKRGRAAGVWLGNLEILGLCEDMNRTGKTSVVSYGNNGTARVLMHDYVVEEGMPALAASAADTGFLGFGDLGSYIVGLVGGVQIATSSEYLFGKNQTAFRGVLNMDIKRKPAATFVLIKTAAA